MTGHPSHVYVFDPEVFAEAMANDPAGALIEMSVYVRAGRLKLTLVNLRAFGTDADETNHFLMSWNLGVRAHPATAEELADGSKP